MMIWITRFVGTEKWTKEIAALIAGGIVFFLASILTNYNFVLASTALIIMAVLLYFYFAYVVDAGNVLSLKGLFSGFWLGTIGLANLKLLEYQIKWETETWFVLALSYCVFVLGFMVMEEMGGISFTVRKRYSQFRSTHVSFRVETDRLFAVCVVTAVIGLASFATNIWIKGYIPFFVTDDYMAYYDFYTRFNIFTVASTAVSGLCYYTIRLRGLSKPKQFILYLIIIYEVFLMPMLAVSRGTQMIAMLSLTVSVVMLNRRKLFIFALCMVIAFGFYQAGSIARHLSNDYLDYVFQPKEITIAAEENSTLQIDAVSAIEIPDENISVGKSAQPERNEVSHEEETPSSETTAVDTIDEEVAEDVEADAQSAITKQTFVLPSQIAFLYGYLTVSHDNLNEAVIHIKEYSFGVRQLQAFTAVLRFPKLKSYIESLDFWQVNDALNTGNLITDAYYDFGALGCGIFLFFWACIFSIIEQNAHHTKSPFAMLALGTCMTPVVLCFFESWMSYFTFWLLLGTNLLLYLASGIHFKRGEG